MIIEDEGIDNLYESRNDQLVHLKKPTLVTAVEVLPANPKVRSGHTRMRISFGVVPKKESLRVVFDDRKNGEQIIVPFSERLYWHDAMENPEQFDFRTNPFTTWQVGGEMLLNARVGGIDDLLAKVRWHHRHISRLNLYIGVNRSTNKLLQLAHFLGIDLANCSAVIPPTTELSRLLR